MDRKKKYKLFRGVPLKKALATWSSSETVKEIDHMTNGS